MIHHSLLLPNSSNFQQECKRLPTVQNYPHLQIILYTYKASSKILQNLRKITEQPSYTSTDYFPHVHNNTDLFSRLPQILFATRIPCRLKGSTIFYGHWRDQTTFSSNALLMLALFRLNTASRYWTPQNHILMIRKWS